MKPGFVLLATALTASLTACGGGGGGSAAEPVLNPNTVTPTVDFVSKYVGTWIGCAPATDRPYVATPGAARVKETLTIVKTGLASFSYSFIREGITDLNCAGTALTSVAMTGSGNISGTKSVTGLRVNGIFVTGTVSAEKFDLIQLTPAADTGTDIAYITGNTVQFGTDQVSSDGYPDILEYTAFVKQ